MSGWTLASVANDAGNAFGVLGLVIAGVVLVVLFFSLMFIASRYRRCPPNRVLVFWGKSGNREK